MKTKLHDAYCKLLEYYNIIYYTLSFVHTQIGCVCIVWFACWAALKKTKKVLLERENTCRRKEPLYGVTYLANKTDCISDNHQQNRQHGSISLPPPKCNCCAGWQKGKGSHKHSLETAGLLNNLWATLNPLDTNHTTFGVLYARRWGCWQKALHFHNKHIKPFFCWLRKSIF